MFSRDRGGYRGLWQFFYDHPFESQQLQAWQDAKYQYAIGTPAYFAPAFAQYRGAEAHMLLLKQFPAPGDTHEWRGETLRFYRLWRPQHETHDILGNAIALVGYDLTQTRAAITLTPYWRAETLPDANYNVYIHLVPLDSRDIIAQADGIPADNRLTRTWYDPAETLIGTTFSVPIPPDAAGDYRLLIGLYNLDTGARLLSETGDDFVEVERVTLPVEDA